MMIPGAVETLARLAVALLLGAVVGWEREKGGKQAGLRTHMLVCLGSCLFTLTGLRLTLELAGTDATIDPSRVVQGIIGGIGFLGAGTLIRTGATVKGLTTAATMWTMGAVGVAAGLGYWLLSTAGAILSLVVLRGVGTFEKKKSPEGEAE
jgi:putative Mg2+ transporter-C (MgtC) family protein